MQPIPPFVWPSLASLHHRMGFIMPDSPLLQGTMREAHQRAPCPWYTTTQIARPVSHQEIQSISTKIQKPQNDQQRQTADITNIQDCREGICCLKLPRLCSKSASKMIILPLPMTRTVCLHWLFHKAWVGCTHSAVKCSVKGWTTSFPQPQYLHSYLLWARWLMLKLCSYGDNWRI